MTYRTDYSTMDRIYAIKSLGDAEDFFMDRGMDRKDAISLVKKIRQAIFNDYAASLRNLLAKPDLLY